MLITKYRKLFIALGLLLALMLGLGLALPTLLKLASVKALQAQGLDASIQHLRLDYLDGTMEIGAVQVKAVDGAGLNLERLVVELDYTALFDKRIHLRRLDISGFDIDIERLEDNRMRIAGIVLPVGSENSESGDWGFGLDAASVEGTELHYRDSVLEETLVIGASSVTDVATWTPAQPILINSHARVKNGLLKLNGQIQPFGEKIILELDIESEALPLGVVAPYIEQTIEGDAASNLQVKLTYSANAALQLSVGGDATIAGLDMQLPSQDIAAQVGTLQWIGQLDLALPGNGLPPVIHAAGDFGSSGLVISQVSSSQKLLALVQLDAEEIKLNGLDDVQVANLTLTTGELLYLKSKSSPEVSWASLLANQLSLKQGNALLIENMRLSGLQARAARSPEGEWNLIKAVPVFKAAEGDNPENTDEQATVHVTINKLETDSGSRINIEDASVNPVFKTELEDIQLTMSSLDSQLPDNPSPLSVNANIGRYGKLELSGHAMPFAETPGLKLNGRLDGANLVPFAGYTGSLIGYGIKQGTVSSDIDVNIASGDIAANFDLVLNKLKVAGVKGKTGEFQGQMGMTLPAALKLMRDRDENIRLSLPVGGPLENPEFGIDEIIQKAIFKAVQVGVLTFYSPLGLVAAADGLFNFATGLRFKPVEFEPASYLLGQGTAAYLDEMAALLSKRPEQQITLCGFASQSDKQAMADSVAQQGVRFFGLYKPQPDVEAISDDALVELAEKRVNLVGDYLVNRGMPSEQLIICGPEIDSDASANGRVEVSL